MSNNEIRFKDTDLREALRRKYANTPTLPADFKERIMKGILKDWNMKTIRLGESITVLAAAIYLTACTAQNDKPQQPQEDYILNDTTAICFPEPIIR